MKYCLIYTSINTELNLIQSSLKNIIQSDIGVFFYFMSTSKNSTNAAIILDNKMVIWDCFRELTRQLTY